MPNVCGTGGWSGPLPGDPDNSVILTATAVFGGIEVSWSYPGTNPHAVAHTQLYRGISANFANAVLRDIVGGNRFYDKFDDGVTYYYWIKIVSINGTVGEPIGPASATANTLFTSITSQFTGGIAYDMLTGQLKTELSQISLLNTNLAQEILDREGSGTSLAAALAAVDAEVAEAHTFITTEIASRTSADAAVAGQINLIAVTLGDEVAAAQVTATAAATRVLGLAAEYMVKVSAGGAISGFGLAATEDPAGNTDSSFVVEAASFAVIAPYNYIQATTPDSPSLNQTWYNTIALPAAEHHVSRRWNGSSWISFVPKVPFGVDTINDYVYLDGGIRVKGTILGGAATDYSTGTGFFAGYVGATYHWRVGDNTKFITWDGTDVIIAGGVKVGSSLTLSEIAAIGLTTTIDIFSVGLSATPTSTTATYTITGDAFSAGNLTAGWSRTQPASSTTATYKSSATVTATAPGTAVTIGTWSAPIVVAQNGTNGDDGVFDATARTILSGTGGLVGGDLAWNSSGVRTSGKGVALTSKGLLGHNGTNTTFTVDAQTGEATLMGVAVLNSSGTVLLSSGMSPSAIANTANAVGGNRLSNSMPTIGSVGPFYVSWGDTGQTCNFQEGFSPHRPDHTGGVCFYFSGTPANATVQDVSYGNATDGWTPFPVVAGSTYEFSAYIGAHSCNACVLIEWYNSSGTAITASTGTWNYQVASTGPLSSYGRYGGIATAPAGSAYVRVSIRAAYLGLVNPYTFFSMMYFGEAGSSQTAFSAWSDGNPGRITPNMASTYIADLAVDTLQIAGNAVTMPLGAFSAGVVSATSGTITAQELTGVVATGQPAIITFTALMFSSTHETMYLELYRDSTMLYKIGAGSGAYEYIIPGSVCFTVKDQPSAGTYTYSVKATGTNNIGVSFRALTYIEAKR